MECRFGCWERIIYAVYYMEGGLVEDISSSIGSWNPQLYCPGAECGLSCKDTECIPVAWFYAGFNDMAAILDAILKFTPPARDPRYPQVVLCLFSFVFLLRLWVRAASNSAYSGYPELWILRYPAHRYHAVPSPGFEPTTLWLRVWRPNHSYDVLVGVPYCN
jgi:hypothetical protein